MNSSPRLSETETGTESQPAAPFAREAGLPYRPEQTGDPIEAWLALMEVVEALCPRWPERTRVHGTDYRL